MKIGIFDSGLGGLAVLEGIRKALPKYDYVYLGDTKHVPYGSQNQATIYQWSKTVVDYLFRTENCQIVVIACNTVSVKALRKLQRGYLLKHFPDRRILGVVVPTMETVVGNRARRVGLIGTTATVRSLVYATELKKLSKHTTLYARATPTLVPLLEEGKMNEASLALKQYLQFFTGKNIDTLILGCTHYCLLKQTARTLLGKTVKVISQDELIPQKLKLYLRKHRETTSLLSKSGSIKLLWTKSNASYKNQDFKTVRLPILPST